MKEEKEIEIRSDEVQEILNEVPNWMIRYGITLIFLIIVAGLILSWFIKYPETVAGTAEITTEQPPVQMVAKMSGYIQNLQFLEGAFIDKNQVIAEISNPVAKETMDSLRIFLRSFSIEEASVQAVKLSAISSLGQGQNDANTLFNLLVEYDKTINDKSFVRTIHSLDKQIEYNTRLAGISQTQLKLFTSEMKSAVEKYNSDSILFSQGVIAKVAYFEKQSEYFSKKQTLLDAKKAGIQYKILASEYSEQKNKLLKEQEDLKRSLTIDIASAIKSLSTFYGEWQMNYLLISPIEGKLAYLSNLSENEFVQAEQPLFAIIPDDDHILGLVHIDQQGYGMIQPGQKVRIKLNNFPYQEYGQLLGFVKEVSKIAGDSGYLLKVHFPQGLLTTYNKEVTYKPGMTGSAEVVTKDLRLLERLFYSFRSLFG